MFGVDDAIAAGLKVLDKFIPDPEAKAKAEYETTETEEPGENEPTEQELDSKEEHEALSL